MAENDFLTFAASATANVSTQAEYAAATEQQDGHQTGIASSKLVNKAARQSSIMSAVLAEIIVDNTALDVIDDGSTDTIKSNLLAALSVALPGRLLGVTVMTASGTFVPNPLATVTRVRGSGGGGAGGGTVATGASTVSIGSGGGSGAYAEIMINSVISSPVTVTIGASGSTVVGGNGGQGGTSSFGSYLSLPGGPGGKASTAGVPPFLSPGSTNSASPTVTGATAMVAFAGTSGGGGFAFGLSSGANGGGRGTANPLGVPGVPSAQGYGTGGNGGTAGASASATAGLPGTAGAFIIEEFA